MIPWAFTNFVGSEYKGLRGSAFIQSMLCLQHTHKIAGWSRALKICASVKRHIQIFGSISSVI